MRPPWGSGEAPKVLPRHMMHPVKAMNSKFNLASSILGQHDLSLPLTERTGNTGAVSYNDLSSLNYCLHGAWLSKLSSRSKIWSLKVKIFLGPKPILASFAHRALSKCYFLSQFQNLVRMRVTFLLNIDLFGKIHYGSKKKIK